MKKFLIPIAFFAVAAHAAPSLELYCDTGSVLMEKLRRLGETPTVMLVDKENDRSYTTFVNSKTQSWSIMLLDKSLGDKACIVDVGKGVIASKSI